jgi:hypothetical protein
MTLNRNSEYRQLKISVDAQIAKAFKESCAAANVPMSSILSMYMATYSKISTEKKTPAPMSTKRQRRAAIDKIIQQLEYVKDCEADYQERIPDNLRSSTRFESAETWVSVLDEVIDLLDSLP